MRRWPALWLGLACGLVLGNACAYETDPYTHRLAPLVDAAPALDREVNAALREVLIEHGSEPREERIVAAVFHRLGGYYWVDHIERWAMDSPEVQKLPTPRWHSIYRDVPLHDSRISGLFGIGPSFLLDGNLIGTDKLGHFFSQGRKFWRRWRRLHDEGRAAAHSAFTERAIFGAPMTGVYSNADLVANYEGYRFYRSLFEDDVVPGKLALLRWQDGHWIQQRQFEWNDFVNAYWDEALNPNAYDGLLAPAMRRRLREFCPEVAQAPERYRVPPDEDARLQQRYRQLQLRDRRDWRLDRLCAESG
ncbi:MAG TPA: hypothetical protein VKM35_06075 [Arenimonas sp.]|uniref:hypothetical protein n=1 Tax=Arenimonas sp. TaxID=1872635 RepID=UPI002CB24F5E|nr:hypothetical protein [Arenimonas sp.]HMB56758.1 hypothetical protein [Arenimonas sp.]